MLREFINISAHELRTPIQAVLDTLKSCSMSPTIPVGQKAIGGKGATFYFTLQEIDDKRTREKNLDKKIM